MKVTGTIIRLWYGTARDRTRDLPYSTCYHKANEPVKSFNIQPNETLSRIKVYQNRNSCARVISQSAIVDILNSNRGNPTVPVQYLL